MPVQNTNVSRLAITPSQSTGFVIEEWEDLPESFMRRFPELRPWNDSMKARFARMQAKLVDFIRAVQET